MHRKCLMCRTFGILLGHMAWLYGQSFQAEVLCSIPSVSEKIFPNIGPGPRGNIRMQLQVCRPMLKRALVTICFSALLPLQQLLTSDIMSVWPANGWAHPVSLLLFCTAGAMMLSGIEDTIPERNLQDYFSSLQPSKASLVYFRKDSEYFYCLSVFRISMLCKRKKNAHKQGNRAGICEKMRNETLVKKTESSCALLNGSNTVGLTPEET